MKTRILTLLLIVFALYACKKDKEPEVVKEEESSGYLWGSFSAMLNGKPWQPFYPDAFPAIGGGTLFSKLDTADQCLGNTHSILLYWTTLQKSESIHLQKFVLSPGRYTVEPEKYQCLPGNHIYASFFSNPDGDTGDQYDIVPTEDNYLEVDSYNKVSKEIKGRFQMTFVLGERGSGHYLPDTVRFTEGVFRTKIDE